MKKRLLSLMFLLPLFCLFITGCQPNIKNTTEAEANITSTDKMEWWRDAKFGLFIHWGVYSIPAGIHNGEEVAGIGEWIMGTGQIPIPEYEKYARSFNPIHFNARDWAKTAKKAGIKYIVITSKHHDGFCMWDSKVSDYDIMDTALYKKDILKNLQQACREEGIRFGLYHSIMDWHHPDAQGPIYLADENNDSPKVNPNFNRYLSEYLRPQLKELMETYEPEILWFDGEWIPDYTHKDGLSIYNELLESNPNLIINNRVDKGRNGMEGMNKDGQFVGDFGTPEQEILDTASDLDWESCMTMNDTWAFKKNDHNWKSSKVLIDNLVDIVAKGGNYLLNVGPDAQGLIPIPSVERLEDMGDWLKINGEAIYNTRTLKNFKQGKYIRYTRAKSGNNFYAIFTEWPGQTAIVKNVKPQVKSKVYLLGYERSFDWTYDETEGIRISIPESLQDKDSRVGKVGKHSWTFKIEGTEAEVSQFTSIQTDGRDALSSNIIFKKTRVELKSRNTDDILFYSIDNQKSWNTYQEPFILKGNQTIAVKAKEANKVISGVQSYEFIDRATLAGIQLEHAPAGQYDGWGEMTLVDTRKGTTDIHDENWLGFQENNLIANLDLGIEKDVEKVTVSFLEAQGAWIFLPTALKVSTSMDNINFKEVGIKEVPTKKTMQETLKEIDVKFEEIKTRYIRVEAINIGKCPEWHPGSGGGAWIFADEIEVH